MGMGGLRAVRRGVRRNPCRLGPLMRLLPTGPQRLILLPPFRLRVNRELVLIFVLVVVVVVLLLVLDICHLGRWPPLRSRHAIACRIVNRKALPCRRLQTAPGNPRSLRNRPTFRIRKGLLLLLVVVAWRRLGRNELPLTCAYRPSAHPRAVQINRHSGSGIPNSEHLRRSGRKSSLRLSDSSMSGFRRLVVDHREMHESLALPGQGQRSGSRREIRSR